MLQYVLLASSCSRGFHSWTHYFDQTLTAALSAVTNVRMEGESVKQVACLVWMESFGNPSILEPVGVWAREMGRNLMVSQTSSRTGGVFAGMPSVWILSQIHILTIPLSHQVMQQMELRR